MQVKRMLDGRLAAQKREGMIKENYKQLCSSLQFSCKNNCVYLVTNWIYKI